MQDRQSPSDLGSRRSADRRGYTARESIANAMAVAQQLSGPLADELLTSALQAFTSGLNAICLLTAVLSVALAELAVLCYIRCRPPPNRIPMWRSPARRNVHGR